MKKFTSPFYFQKYLNYYWWFIFQQKLIHCGLKKKAYYIIKSIIYILYYSKKFKTSNNNNLYLLPTQIVFSLKKLSRAGKKYEVPVLLNKKKRYKFFIHYLFYFAKLRLEATFVLKIVAELLDFINQRGKLYKFVINIYLTAWTNRLIRR